MNIVKCEFCDSPVISRGWCSKHYQRWKKTGDPLGFRERSPLSDEKRSKSIREKWLDPDYRARQLVAREANRELAAEKQRQNWSDPEYRERQSKAKRISGTDHYISKQGYVVLRYQFDHPLASFYGELLEHRKVLYEKIGPGSHPCHWCGKMREWANGGQGIHVDHLDDDKLNNNPDNLVPSCKRCNGYRSKEVIKPCR